MPANEWADINMNYNAIRKLRLEWIRDDIEMEPEEPYDGEVAESLVFAPGLIWFAGFRRTIRFTFESYAFDDLPGEDYVARQRTSALDSNTTFTVIHNMNTYPLVQIINGSGVVQTSAITSITHSSVNQFTVIMGSTFSGTAIIVG